MNKRIASFLLAGMLVWATGCSEPEPSIISVDEIKKLIITTVNAALDQKKDDKSQSIAVKNNSDTCNINIPDSPQENKTINIECYGSDTSVTAILPRNGFWMIKGIAFHWWKLETQSGCIVWNIRLKNGEILKINTCDTKVSA